MSLRRFGHGPALARLDHRSRTVAVSPSASPRRVLSPLTLVRLLQWGVGLPDPFSAPHPWPFRSPFRGGPSPPSRSRLRSRGVEQDARGVIGGARPGVDLLVQLGSHRAGYRLEHLLDPVVDLVEAWSAPSPVPIRAGISTSRRSSMKVESRPASITNGCPRPAGSRRRGGPLMLRGPDCSEAQRQPGDPKSSMSCSRPSSRSRSRIGPDRMVEGDRLLNRPRSVTEAGPEVEDSAHSGLAARLADVGPAEGVSVRVVAPGLGVLVGGGRVADGLGAKGLASSSSFAAAMAPSIKAKFRARAGSRGGPSQVVGCRDLVAVGQRPLARWDPMNPLLP